MAKSVQEDKATEPKFTKESLLKSQKYADFRDLLSALLAEEKEYSHTEVESMVKKFREGKVK